MKSEESKEKQTAQRGQKVTSKMIFSSATWFMANMRLRTRKATDVQEQLPVVYGNYTSLSQPI